jgi:magnesium chelatase family protein
MSLATVYSRALMGINAPLVTVEAHITNGLPALSIVGLPEMAVRESKDRVRAAIINAGFEFPARKITINLAPADLPKEGGRFDLAIALGILAASGQLPAHSLQQHEFLGELALGGQLRAVKGSLPTALHCANANRQLIVPDLNAGEAALAENCTVLPANHLLSVCAHLSGREILPPQPTVRTAPEFRYAVDLSEVKAQPQAKRALEIAAAGEHNLLMIGPPGTGKTMLATRLPTILPPMSPQEALESAAIFSISDEGFSADRWGQRIFRAPHHTASAVALVGGGSTPRPGEVSLAHQGVLFLDEFTEYDRRVLDVLREPLEKGRIIISRAARQAEFPARFQLIAAMNPCPCGYLGDSKTVCACTAEQVRRYRARISGPILDRIDLHIHVPRLTREQLQAANTEDNNHRAETSAEVRRRVTLCRERQLQRTGAANARMNQKQIRQHCKLQTSGQALLDSAINRLGLSARAYDRILKIARTIADLDEAHDIQTPHIAEAISYRAMDR